MEVLSFGKSMFNWKKTGLPKYIRISRNGSPIVFVEDLQETMWAIGQENTLYCL